MPTEIGIIGSPGALVFFFGADVVWYSWSNLRKSRRLLLNHASYFTKALYTPSPVVGKMYLYMCQGMNKVKASKEEKYFRPEARPKAPPQARVPFSLREPPWA